MRAAIQASEVMGQAPHLNGSAEVPMTKLMAVAAFFAAVYVIDPAFAGTLDSQMRVLAWKINSALDVRPFLRG
jgi:hypothetical protein